MDQIKRIFRIDGELKNANNYPNVMYGLTDSDDMTRSKITATLVVGDNIVNAEVFCGPQYPKVAPIIKFSDIAYDDFSAIRKLCDKKRYIRRDSDFIVSWVPESTIGDLLTNIYEYISNY